MIDIAQIIRIQVCIVYLVCNFVLPVEYVLRGRVLLQLGNGTEAVILTVALGITITKT